MKQARVSTRLRRRFWLEVALDALSIAVFAVTLVRRDWIEALVGIDPDRHSGLLEWLIVGGVLVVTLVLLSLTRYEWRRARPAERSTR